MTFTFKPAVYKNSLLYELPRPIAALRILDAWDSLQLKVPLAPGDTLTGHSRQGIDITIEGRFGSQAGNLSLTEEEMFTAWAMLRDVLNVTDATDKFEFFLYHDSSTSTYRKFKNCSATRLECDLSTKQLFEFSLLLHVEDPTLYSTAPGA